MKKIFIFSIIFLILLGLNAKAYEMPSDIKINGEYIVLNSEIIIEDGTALAPVRSLCNALGAKSVTWEKNVAKILINNKNMRLDTLNSVIYVDNESHFFEDKVKIICDKTYAPVRFIAETAGCEVVWNDTFKNIEIILKNHTVNKEYVNKSYTDDDILWLSKIIHAESEGEPLEGKIAVGNVILNRVKSSEFPSTIYGVIFDKTYAVQFEPVSNGTIYNSPGKESIKAAKLALNDVRLVGDCLYFYNPYKISSTWISKNREYFKTINNHAFYF